MRRVVRARRAGSRGKEGARGFPGREQEFRDCGGVTSAWWLRRRETSASVDGCAGRESGLVRTFRTFGVRVPTVRLTGRGGRSRAPARRRSHEGTSSRDRRASVLARSWFRAGPDPGGNSPAPFLSGFSTRGRSPASTDGHRLTRCGIEITFDELKLRPCRGLVPRGTTRRPLPRGSGHAVNSGGVLRQ